MGADKGPCEGHAEAEETRGDREDTVNGPQQAQQYRLRRGTRGGASLNTLRCFF